MAEPVTVTIARTIPPDRADDFEEFSRQVMGAASGWPGFLGGGLLRPPPGGTEYHVVYRFTDPERLRRWEESDERRDLLARTEPFVRTVDVWRVQGLSDWFDLPGRGSTSPPRWKLATIALACVIPMSLLISAWIAPALDFLPLLPRTVVTSILFAIYMTWFAVPWLSGVANRWLYPRD